MTFEEAERAGQYLVDSAAKYGNARADAEKAEAMLRHVKAIAMKASGEASIGAQEREAYASPEYLAAIEELFQATKVAETIKASREAAKVRVDLWRSFNASLREAG